jgi:hypothetical protein
MCAYQIDGHFLFNYGIHQQVYDEDILDLMILPKLGDQMKKMGFFYF